MTRVSSFENGRNEKNNGPFHTGSAQGSAQCEHGSARIFSAGLEFLIRAAGCSH